MKNRYLSNAVTISLAIVLSAVFAPITVYGQQTSTSEAEIE